MAATTTIGHRVPRLVSFAVFALAVAVFAFAAGPAASAPPNTSPHGIIINHKHMVVDIGLTCDNCHSPSTTKPQLMAFPTMDTCAVCHADETDMSKGTDKCAMCHTNADYSSTMPVDTVLMPEIKFDHRVHADAKVDCLSCHKIFDKIGVTGNEMLPTMNTCITCHKAKSVPNGTECATCHVNSNIGSAKPASHTAEWIHVHGKGLSLATIQGTCDVCHTVQSGNDCNSCHQREKPPTHNAGWVLGAHSIAARANPQSCTTCHSQQQCLDCHTQEQPWTHNGTWGNTSIPGKNGASTPEPRHCVACHADSSGKPAAGTSCAVCHSNPDRNLPSGTTSSHAVMASSYGLACLTCH